MVERQQRAVEIKHIQRQISEYTNVDADGTITSNIINIAQGSGDTERIGDKVVVTSIQLHMQYTFGFDSVNINPDGTSLTFTYLQGAIFRFILFWDHTNSIDTVAKVIGTASTEQWLFMNGYEVDYRPNYTIICDKTFECNPSGGGTNCIQYKYFNCFKRFINGVRMQYNAGTTTVNKNALKLLLITNVETAESNDIKPDILVNARIYYKDA
jgi:hypothetical protein